MSQELQDYISQARKVGKSDEEITKELINAGWKLDIINKSLSNNSQKMSVPVAPNNNVTLKAIKVFILLFVVVLMFYIWNILGVLGIVLGGLFLFPFIGIPSFFAIKSIRQILDNYVKGEGKVGKYAIALVIFVGLFLTLGNIMLKILQSSFNSMLLS